MTSVTDPKEAIADCCGVMLRKICSSCSSCLMTDSRTVGVLVSASIVICLIWANRLVDRLMLAERSNWLAASLGMAPLNRRESPVLSLYPSRSAVQEGFIVRRNECGTKKVSW